MDEHIWLDATGQAEAIRAGEVSAVELLEAHFRRIGDLNGDLRALVSLDEAGALAQARTIDEQHRADPQSLPAFAGVPLSIKDTDDVAGLPTTQSCELLSKNVAPVDGPVVRRLRTSGAAIVGKSHVPEFCSTLTNSRLFGICRNPWDLARTAGGSSGGAAAALAAGLCAISHGTDGAGSVRAPASWCGLVGVKPTRRLVTFGPEEDPVCYQSSVHGVLVRSVRDAAAMLDVLAPPGPWTPVRPGRYVDEAQIPPDQLRVAVSTRFPMGAVDPEVASAVRDAGRLVEALGHVVSEADPAWEVVLAAAGLPLSAPHISRYVSLDQIDRLEPRNQSALRREAEMTVLDFFRLAETARGASRRFVEFWEDVDVLLTPTVGIVAPPVDWARWDQDAAAHLQTFATLPNFAHPFNITGQPALSLPLGWSASGMPIGVQLVGRRLEEAVVLRLAAQIETASPWLERITAAGRALNS
jgi:amidase